VVAERFRVKSVRSGAVLRDVAERRWNEALTRQFADRPAEFARLIEAIDDELKVEATDAEVAREGSGLVLIIERVASRDGPGGAT
jgi:hypothetical protein